MDLQKVGKFIAKHRKNKNLTQDKLGDIIGVSGKTISKWERGVNAPDISVLNKLSEILEVNVSEILNGQEESVLNDNSKAIIDNITYYAKQERIKYLKIIRNVMIILILAFSCLFTISNYNRFKMYSVKSKYKKYFVEGNIVFNQKKNLILIKNIDIKDNNIGTESEEKIKNIKISIESRNKIIFSVFYENEKYEYPISSYLLNRAYCSDEKVNSDENIISKNIDFDDMKIKVEYINNKDEKKIIEIPLIIEKDYANNQLIY